MENFAIIRMSTDGELCCKDCPHGRKIEDIHLDVAYCNMFNIRLAIVKSETYGDFKVKRCAKCLKNELLKQEKPTLLVDEVENWLLDEKNNKTTT